VEHLRSLPTHGRLVALGLVLCAVYATTDGLAHGGALVLSTAIPAVVVLRRLAAGQIRRSAPWWLLAAALVTLTVNAAVWYVAVCVQGQVAADGLVSKVTLALGYALLLAAALGILSPFVRRDRSGLIDAAVMWLASASVLWAVVIHPTLVRRDVGPGDRAYTLLLVLLVSGLAGMVLQAAVGNRAARPALRYLSVAVILTLAGNVARALTFDPATQTSARWIGLVWIVAYSSAAAAAAHPSHAALAEPQPAKPDRLSRSRLVVFGLALGVNPLLAEVQGAVSGNVDWMLLTSATLVIVPLVVVRIAHLARRQAAAERALLLLATRDELTQLPNRRAAITRLSAGIDRVGSGASAGLTVLFLDVDRLKEINDDLGHNAGDEVLVGVAGRLVESIGPDALAARFGGDEFIVIDEGPPADAATRIDAVRTALDRPLLIGTVPVQVGASIGVHEIGPGSEVTAAQVIAEADRRMYADKRLRARTT